MDCHDCWYVVLNISLTGGIVSGLRRQALRAARANVRHFLKSSFQAPAVAKCPRIAEGCDHALGQPFREARPPRRRRKAIRARAVELGAIQVERRRLRLSFGPHVELRRALEVKTEVDDSDGGFASAPSGSVRRLPAPPPITPAGRIRHSRPYLSSRRTMSSSPR